MTAPKKPRLALVGLGRMGRNHLRVVRETPHFELAAVVDAKAPAPADLGSVPMLRGLEELSKIDYDAAIVATPTATHHEIAMELVGQGKSLLVEKPVASTEQQSRELLEAATKKGVRLAVGHVERFNPAVRKAREVIREGFLGQPIHFSFTRVGGYPDTLMQGNNVILDLAVHDLDVLRSIVGPVALDTSLCHATWKPGVLDTAEIVLASASGASASIHVNWITPTKIRTMRVTGTRGVCFVDYILQTVELFGGSLLKPVELHVTNFEVLVDGYRNGDKIAFGVRKEEPLKAQLAEFRRFFDTGEPGELALGRDALAAVVLAERAVQKGDNRPKPTVPPSTDPLPPADAVWI